MRLETEPKGILALDTEVANRWWWYDGKSTHRLMIFVGAWVETREDYPQMPPFGLIMLPDILLRHRVTLDEFRGLPVVTRAEGLRRIRGTIEDADVLVGHNLTGFDIGTINGELKLLNMPLLPERPVIDTLNSARKVIGQSMSLANRLSRLPGTVEKPHVDPAVWEAAFNEFEPEAMREVYSRAVTDVQGHIDLFHNDLERSYV
jgi:DNA polymerase elongation subunit (family B)